MLRKRREYHKEIEDLIDTSVEFIAAGRLQDAYEAMDSALAMDFDHPRVLCGLKYINFWQSRIKTVITQGEAFEQAEMYLQKWKDFLRFTSGFPSDEQFIQGFRKLIFTRVYRLFSAQKNQQQEEDPEIQLWLGIASKGMGDYESARGHLEAAMASGSGGARLLSELADVNALTGDEHMARVFIREAFFLDPQAVDIEAFEAELFVRLIAQLRETGLQDDELKEWLPVYGILWGVFTIKRELRALEYGKLRQKIFALEQEVRDADRERLVKPRLLNHYFWLIDHLVMNREDQRKIDEILLKIRSISSEVYKLYTK